MTSISIKLPDSLARKTREIAGRDGITVNQFVSTAVSEKLCGWITDEYIKQKAKKANKKKFLDALNQAPDAPPVKGDEL
jgi:predicted transcriptional regulator